MMEYGRICKKKISDIFVVLMGISWAVPEGHILQSKPQHISIYRSNIYLLNLTDTDRNNFKCIKPDEPKTCS
jgi:hypothetical protein